MIHEPMTIAISWTARILSVLYLAFFLFMLTAHLLDTAERDALMALTFREGLGFFFVGVMFVGYFLAWKWEALGGALGVVAIIAFRLAIYVPFTMLTIMVAPGFLFLLCGRLRRRHEQP